MKITGFALQEERFALKVPFVTALRRVEEIEALHLTVTTDEDCYGQGAASPTAAITGDTAQSIRGALLVIERAIAGEEAENLNGLLAKVSAALVGNTSAKAAADMALYDLFSRRAALPLCALLGGHPKPLSTDLTISLRDVDAMVADARDAETLGMDTLKIKLGRDAEEDFRRYRAIRSAVSCTLRIDANQGWSTKQTLRFMDRCAVLDITPDFLEQPVKAADLSAMAFIRNRIDCPLIADESVFSPAEALRAIEAGAADCINIKLMKCGGIYQALKIAALAESARLDVMIGCMMESPLGVAAALHLASALPSVKYLDLDVPFLMREIPGNYGFSCALPRLVAKPGIGLIDGGTD